MKKSRKTISFLLIVSLMLGLLCPAPFGAASLGEVQAVAIQEPSGPTEGTFGDITWKLEVDPDGRIYSEEEEEEGAVQPTCYKLLLTGTGEMDKSLFGSSAPWYAHCEVITSVSISEGITSLCDKGLAELCSLKSITLPDSIATIGQQAFQKDYSLETVICGKGLKTIEKQAFSECYCLSQITFQEGLETIGVSAFDSCEGLTSVSLPESLTTIKTGALYCGLSSITIPQNVSCIEDAAIWVYEEIIVAEGNTHFQVQDNVLYELKEDGTPWRALAYAIWDHTGSVSLAEGTELVAPYAFDRAQYITELTLPNTLSRIGDYAFFGCSALGLNGELKLPEGLTSIGNYAFDWNIYLKNLQLPDSLQTIGNYAFRNCWSLESLQLPDSLKSIGGGAFYCCEKIREVKIPDSVVTIGGAAFGSCHSLKTVTIGKGLKTIGTVFSESNNIETITVDPENPYLKSLDNIVYTKEDKPTLCYYATGKPDKEYHIPEPVYRLGEHGIENVVALEKLYLPKTLERIEFAGIAYNKNLKSVYFAGNAPCSNGLVENNKSLILYKTADSTGWDNDMYGWDYEYEFTFAIWEPDNTLQESGFMGDVAWIYNGSDRSLVFSGIGPVPDFTEEEPVPWNGYMDSIQTIEAKTVTEIGDYGFCNASGLLRVETGTELNRIGDYTFADCASLKFVDIPTIDTIGTCAFKNCSSIAGSLTLEKISALGAGAFQNCSAIPSVTLGSRLTALEPEVFAGCSSLASLILPEKVSAIGEGALKGCSSLRTVNIPTGTVAIGAQAFSGDTALEKVYFYGGIPADWAPDSFENCGSRLTLCYRTAQTGWAGLGGAWNSIPLLAQERFYTERQDHYSFSNNSSSFGYPAGYHFPKRRYVETLGSISIGTYYYVLDGNWMGSCYGMVGSTLEFYENPSGFPLTDYSPSANTLYEIAAPRDKFAALTKLIETCQISQYHIKISGCGGLIGRNMGRYQEMVRRIEEFERSGGLRVDSTAEPIILTVFSGYSGHAVIPVSVDQDEMGNFLVQVYDPNYPSALQTLTINKDYSGMSYRKYFKASFVPYGNFIASMSGVQPYSQEDPTLYLSIDKEYGVATDESGRGVDEIEGAYEQKPMTGEEESFTGIRRFVLPEGNYQLTTDVPEGETETTNPESVTFYMGSEECFAEITSSDENAVLKVNEIGTTNGELVLELQSDSEAEETAEFTLVNAQGMERIVEIGAGNATLSIGENYDIAIEAPGQESVIVDGQEIELTEGKTGSSFIAGAEENPLKTENLETEIICDQKNKLNGTLNAEVFSNTAECKEVTITAEFFENNDSPVAVFSEKRILNPGLNLISLSLEELETTFRKGTGNLILSCRFVVTDENENASVLTGDDISITLTEQSDKDDSGDENPETPGGTTGETPGETPGGTTGETPGETPGGTTGETPGETPGGTTGETPGETPGGTTGETPGETPGGTTGETPGETPGGTTGETPGETPGGTTGETPGDSTGETPGSSDDKTPANTESLVTGKREVTMVKTDVKSLTLGVGETYNLKASVRPANASDKSLRYTAFNKKVTVNAKGKIKAQKTGFSKVIITASNGKKATVKVTVKKKPSRITLNAKTKSVKVGRKFQIKVRFPKGSTSRKLTYTSSKKSVAIVSPDGKVIARKKGSAIITVKTYNGKKAKLKVNVKK